MLYRPFHGRWNWFLKPRSPWRKFTKGCAPNVSIGLSNTRNYMRLIVHNKFIKRINIATLPKTQSSTALHILRSQQQQLSTTSVLTLCGTRLHKMKNTTFYFVATTGWSPVNRRTARNIMDWQPSVTGFDWDDPVCRNVNSVTHKWKWEISARNENMSFVDLI